MEKLEKDNGCYALKCKVLNFANYILGWIVAIITFFLLFGLWLAVAPFVISNFGAFVMILPVVFIGVGLYAGAKYAKENNLTRKKMISKLVLAATIGLTMGLFLDVMVASLFLGGVSDVFHLVQHQIEIGIQTDASGVVNHMAALPPKK